MKRPSRIVILTGAGISKESGLATFRDADGIWATVKVEEVATPEAFARDPARVHAFYNMRRRNLLANPEVAPNAAHLALAELERGWAGEFLLITQNVDNLHERAGSQELIHMHGEHLRARCTSCARVHDWRDELSAETVSPCCGAVGGLRPHVVWFGETPFELDRIFAALARCDLFVSIGTSGTVYPAAGFVAEARAAGAHAVELNLEPSHGAQLFHEAIHGAATEIVPAFVARLLGRS